MINNNEPLSMAESSEYVTKDSEVMKFVKDFTKLKSAEAKEFKEKLEELKMMQLKPQNIVKIIDFLPESKEDLNKILMGMGLDEDDTKKILEIVDQYR